MQIYEFTCDRCQATGSYSLASFGRYRLEDGTMIPRLEQPAWCLECNTLRSAELLQDLDHFAAALQTMAADDRSRPLFLAGYRWREMRQSPPRCLSCASIRVLLLTPDPDQLLEIFEHPGCGGTFRQTARFHASQGGSQTLDAEGRPYDRPAASS